jgi:diketogulonate reductase-like aldo/keto reductase
MVQPPIGAQASRLARDHTLLGGSATRMPKLIYGTAWKKDKTADLVYNAIRAGFRGVDTAAQPKHYHEAGCASGVRRAIAEKIVTRQDLFVSDERSRMNGSDNKMCPPRIYVM